MRIVILPDSDEAGAAVARLIAQYVGATPHPVLGLATGSSVEPVYRALHAESPDLSAAQAFALDEYVGLPTGHPESYRKSLLRQFAEPLGLPRTQLHVPDGAADDPDREAARYDGRIAESGGVGLQLLGIGRNGHIGFNEPGSPLDSRTRVVRLTEDTRTANARFFPGLDAVPRRSITQGLGTIFEARRLVLIANTPDKAAAVERMVLGPVTTDVPASLLQRHPDADVVLTEAAAARLPASVASGGSLHAAVSARPGSL